MNYKADSRCNLLHTQVILNGSKPKQLSSLPTHLLIRESRIAVRVKSVMNGEVRSGRAVKWGARNSAEAQFLPLKYESVGRQLKANLSKKKNQVKGGNRRWRDQKHFAEIYH